MDAVEDAEEAEEAGVDLLVGKPPRPSDRRTVIGTSSRARGRR
ncbi:hypothetical protein [Saccharopolyspora rhizosphaerae]|nr:hypothetical protein [Saccharopolyspora rhizosphaerae]